jgi:hypothetical protein
MRKIGKSLLILGLILIVFSIILDTFKADKTILGCTYLGSLPLLFIGVIMCPFPNKGKPIF